MCPERIYYCFRTENHFHISVRKWSKDLFLTLCGNPCILSHMSTVIPPEFGHCMFEFFYSDIKVKGQTDTFIVPCLITEVVGFNSLMIVLKK